MQWIGVFVGGTFTDIVIYDAEHAVPREVGYSATMPMRSECNVSESIHATSWSPSRFGSVSGSRSRAAATLVDRMRQAHGVGP